MAEANTRQTCSPTDGRFSCASHIPPVAVVRMAGPGKLPWGSADMLGMRT